MEIATQYIRDCINSGHAKHFGRCMGIVLYASSMVA